MADHFGTETTPFSLEIRDEIIRIMMEEEDNEDGEEQELKDLYDKEYFETSGSNSVRIKYYTDSDNLVSLCTPEEVIHGGAINLENLEMDIGRGEKAYAESGIYMNGRDSDIEDHLSYSIYQSGKVVAEIVQVPEDETSKSRDRLYDSPLIDDVLAFWRDNQKFPELPGRCTKLVLNGKKQAI